MADVAEGAGMKTRSLEPEILDVRRPSGAELESTTRFLSWINRRLGGVRALRRALERVEWTGALRVLDVATGDAEVPRALVEWARSAGRALEIVALDRERDMVELAARRSAAYPEITCVLGDALSIPFAARSFDFVMSSLFLHHLADDAVVGALREFDRVARRGVVVTDLIRRRRLHWWTKFFTWFGNDIVRVDGPLSVRKAFTIEEIRGLAAGAGLGWISVEESFGHRFVLRGERV
jgi:ubiquinone/menaquinone biosynthesis C-methylase UbiE